MKHLILENFQEEVIESDKPTLVVFKSENCHLCHGLTKVMFRLRRMYIKHIKFCYVETSRESELADIFEIDGVPTIILFVDGDGYEMKYPENPSSVSGYSEEYLTDCLSGFLKG